MSILTLEGRLAYLAERAQNHPGKTPAHALKKAAQKIGIQFSTFLGLIAELRNETEVQTKNLPARVAQLETAVAGIHRIIQGRPLTKKQGELFVNTSPENWQIHPEVLRTAALCTISGNNSQKAAGEELIQVIEKARVLTKEKDRQNDIQNPRF